MPRLLALIVLLIVYGSLYPWQFSLPRGGFAPAIGLLLSGTGPYYFRDVLVNIVVYMPVGACAYLALRQRLRTLSASLVAVVLGTGLSVGVELAQGFARWRRTSVYDVYANALGTAVGVCVALLFSNMSTALNRRAGAERPDPGALALIVCWLAYLSFPFVLSPAGITTTAKLTHALSFAFLPFASAAVAWFVVGNAVKAAGGRHARFLCALSTVLIPAQLLVFRREPTVAEFIGAIAGASIFAYLYERESRNKVAAIGMIVLLIVRGLLPVEFGAHVQGFNWIPFASVLQADWYRASQVLLEKLFFYGAAIWSLRSAGARLRTATFATAAVLALIEAAQIWLPRTPEITDPILALMIGLGLDDFRPQPKRISNPSGISA